MGHRYFSNIQEMFETDQNHGPRHQAAERYMPTGWAADVEYHSIHHPAESMMTREMHYNSQSHLHGRRNELPSSNFRFEGPHVQTALPGGSLNQFPHPLAAQGHYMTPEDNIVHGNGSHYDDHVNNQLPRGSLGPVTNNRGPYKRKNPGISASSERGSIDRSYWTGSSSSSTQSHQEKAPLDYPGQPSCSSSWDRGFSIGVEDTRRNVRSRAGLDMDIITHRTQLPSYFPNYHGPSHRDHYSFGTDYNLNLNTAYEQNCPLQPFANSRPPSSGHYGLRHGLGQHLGYRGPTETNGYHHEFSLRRDSNPPQYHGPHGHTALEGHGYHLPRSLTPNGDNLSNLQATARELAPPNGSSFLPDIPRYQRQGSRSWDNHQRDRRSRMAARRFQWLSNTAATNDNLRSEAALVVDRSYDYIYIDTYDLYGDMRLDIDNMTYEELLALEERIGNVSTGLSEDVMSKSFMETTYNDMNGDELSCAICLEQYKKGDKIGTLKNCRHDYHTYCIKTWLAMKNSCPICKSSAVGDR